MSGESAALNPRLVSEMTGENAIRLDRQYAELIELVWSCERQWTIDDRIDDAINYGRR